MSGDDRGRGRLGPSARAGRTQDEERPRATAAVRLTRLGTSRASPRAATPRLEDDRRPRSLSSYGSSAGHRARARPSRLDVGESSFGPPTKQGLSGRHPLAKPHREPGRAPVERSGTRRHRRTPPRRRPASSAMVGAMSARDERRVRRCATLGIRIRTHADAGLVRTLLGPPVLAERETVVEVKITTVSASSPRERTAANDLAERVVDREQRLVRTTMAARSAVRAAASSGARSGPGGLSVTRPLDRGRRRTTRPANAPRPRCRGPGGWSGRPNHRRTLIGRPRERTGRRVGRLGRVVGVGVTVRGEVILFEQRVVEVQARLRAVLPSPPAIPSGGTYAVRSNGYRFRYLRPVPWLALVVQPRRERRGLSATLRPGVSNAGVVGEPPVSSWPRRAAERCVHVAVLETTSGRPVERSALRTASRRTVRDRAAAGHR